MNSDHIPPILIPTIVRITLPLWADDDEVKTKPQILPEENNTAHTAIAVSVYETPQMLQKITAVIASEVAKNDAAINQLLELNSDSRIAQFAALLLHYHARQFLNLTTQAQTIFDIKHQTHFRIDTHTFSEYFNNEPVVSALVYPRGEVYPHPLTTEQFRNLLRENPFEVLQEY